MTNYRLANCGHCDIEESERACRKPDGKGYRGCPTLMQNSFIEASSREYTKNAVAHFARQASVQEAECYIDRDKKPFVSKPVKIRIQEIYEFAHKMDYRRLGLAFCTGLKREARAVTRILQNQHFEVVSVVCKTGCIPKEHLGLKEDDKIRIGQFESMCNPIIQALVMNDAKTDFNIVLGLCVGHDSLFFKYAVAPVTVLATKDRVTGHNALSPVYTLDSYYSRLLRNPKNIEHQSSTDDSV